MMVQEVGDPERIVESFLNPPLESEEDGAYEILVSRNELHTSPERILKALTDQFRHEIHG